MRTSLSESPINMNSGRFLCFSKLAQSTRGCALSHGIQSAASRLNAFQVSLHSSGIVTIIPVKILRIRHIFGLLGERIQDWNLFPGKIRHIDLRQPGNDSCKTKNDIQSCSLCGIESSIPCCIIG